MESQTIDNNTVLISKPGLYKIKRNITMGRDPKTNEICKHTITYNLEKLD